MIWAFSRLLLIFVFTLTTIVLVVFSLRMVGGGQTYAPFQHPLTNAKTWLVADGGNLDLGPAQSHAALEGAKNLSPKIFIGLKIRQTRDGHWVLYEPTRLEEATTGTGYVSQMSLEELRNIHFRISQETLVTLEEALNLLPSNPLYIEVLQPAGVSLSEIFEILKKYHAEERVVLSSPYLATTKSIRDESASWLTGASVAETSKAEIMTAIYLETLMDMPSEVIVTEKINPRLMTELERRKKIILLKTNNPQEWSHYAQTFPTLGVVTTRPSLFLQMVDTNQNSH